MDHLIEDLTCSVCFNLYDDPRLLKCSHTFCRDCLENIFRTTDNNYFWRLAVGRIKCPTCRMMTEISTGVHTLPINFALKSIVEKVQSSTLSRARTCPEHHGKPLNLFCCKDKRLICDQCCEAGQHQDHPTEDLERAYRKERKTACNLLATLREKNFTGVSAVIKNLEEQLEECKTIIQEDKKEAVSFFNNIIELFEQKKQQFLAALNDLDEEIADAYAPKIEAMRQIQDEELDLISLASATQDEESPIIYLDNIHTIKKGMKALKKRKLCSVPPVQICPRIGQVLKDQWTKTIINAREQPIPKFTFQCNAKCNINSFQWIYFVVILLILFLFSTALLCMVYPDILLTCIACCETCLRNTILEPILRCFGMFQSFTVKSTSQKMAQSFFDLVNHIFP